MPRVTCLLHSARERLDRDRYWTFSAGKKLDMNMDRSGIYSCALQCSSQYSSSFRLQYACAYRLLSPFCMSALCSKLYCMEVLHPVLYITCAHIVHFIPVFLMMLELPVSVLSSTWSCYRSWVMTAVASGSPTWPWGAYCRGLVDSSHRRLITFWF